MIEKDPKPVDDNKDKKDADKTTEEKNKEIEQKYSMDDDNDYE